MHYEAFACHYIYLPGMAGNYKPFFLLFLVLGIAVNLSGINTGFFTDDPGLYASIAKNMLHRGDIWQLFTYNTDWLDKPHFPFWAVFVSFKIFGISAWAYRLPALLCFLLSLRYTYLFARKFYTEEVAYTAVLILITAQHVILSNTDVRAEPYLMAFIIGAIYHISGLNERFNYRDLLLSALLAALAIMTKGVFVIVPIFGSLLGNLVFQRRFKDVFAAKWWLLYLLTLIFTLPEFYALYIQFDAHPEKTVFGRQQVSGIRWFLWDSQFGRFANNGPIKQTKSGDVFFYLHTMLWAFLPWCLLFYYAVFETIKSAIHKIKQPEYYMLSGGMLLLILFSLSRFQLPFYTNILFPLLAVITAPYCYKVLSKTGNAIRLWSQLVVTVLLPIVIIALHIYLRPESSLWFVSAFVLFAMLVAIICLKVKQPTYRVFMLTCSVMLFVNLYLNTTVFPLLASYNAQVSAGRYVNQPAFNGYKVYSLRQSNNVFQFYFNKPSAFIPMEEFAAFKPQGKAVFFISQATKDYLEQAHAPFIVIKSFVNYPQENLSLKFINSQTRQQTLQQAYLITK